MQIKIAFGNMWGGFFPNDNIITNSLRMSHDVIVDNVNPDVVICQHTEGMPAKHITERFKGKAKIIHWYVEAANRIGEPDYNDCDYSITTCTFDNEKNLRLPHWSMYIDWFNDPYVANRNQSFLMCPEKLTSSYRKSIEKQKFCCILTNNDMGLRGSHYPQFIRLAQKDGLEVESRGKFCRTFPPLEDNRCELFKMNFIKDFKFHMCYENADVLGYVTEKIIHPMFDGVIPVYWGTEDVKKEFNPDRFVYAGDYSSVEEVYQRVVQIHSNDELFYEIQSQPRFINNKIPYWATPEYIMTILTRFLEA
tara:strand:- start:242 stop:1162 length:921 start_codon:yes stop_codon:yes gene_type:complete